MAKQTRWMAIGLLVALAGCGPSPRDFLADKRFNAEQKLAKVAEARALLAKTEPIKTDALTDPGTPVRICDLLFPPFGPERCNAWVIDAAEFNDPMHFPEPKPYLSFGDTSWLVISSSLLATGRYPPSKVFPDGPEPDGVGARLDGVFRWLGDVRFLFVVRTLELTKPTIEAGKGYKAGKFRGEVLFFDLDGPSYLGGSACSYTMSGKISVHVEKGANQSPELDAQFTKAVRQEVVKCIAQFMTLTEAKEPTPRRPAF